MKYQGLREIYSYDEDFETIEDDGDPPAADRYTEAKLAQVSTPLLEDLVPSGLSTAKKGSPMFKSSKRFANTS